MNIAQWEKASVLIDTAYFRASDGVVYLNEYPFDKLLHTKPRPPVYLGKIQSRRSNATIRYFVFPFPCNQYPLQREMNEWARRSVTLLQQAYEGAKANSAYFEAPYSYYYWYRRYPHLGMRMSNRSRTFTLVGIYASFQEATFTTQARMYKEARKREWFATLPHPQMEFFDSAGWPTPTITHALTHLVDEVRKATTIQQVVETQNMVKEALAQVELLQQAHTKLQERARNLMSPV